MNSLFPIYRTGRNHVSTSIPYTLDGIFSALDKTFNGMDCDSTDVSYNYPLANIVTTNKGFDIQLAAPGMSCDDFETSVDDNTLKIKVDTHDTKDYEDRVNHREYRFTSWSRSFNLPKNTLVEQISARYEHGILYVNIPVEKKTCTNRSITVE